MASQRHNIVVVEDDPGTQKATARLLRTYGYDVEIFASAEQFLERTSNMKIDCLLLDINLGAGSMSGIELQQKLVETGFSSPIIFTTGHDDERSIGKAIDHGCVAYLSKPFEPQSLMRAIEQAMGQV